MSKCDESNVTHSWIVLDRILVSPDTVKFFFICTKCLAIDQKELKSGIEYDDVKPSMEGGELVK